ncbi:alpha/beta hydrolase family protein [Marinicella sp. W31]|uniref:alpha/beta hydrolase family protein n=1 Tax=Marinicella sp. W31 TaxID=3023713 RepID=UPI0037583E49
MSYPHITTQQLTFELTCGTVNSALWFPSERGIKILPYDDLFEATAYRDGDAIPGRFPLVVISHGSGGNSYSMSYLAEKLARSGCYVLSISHGKQTTGSERWRELYLYPQRVYESVECLKEKKELSQHIDYSNIFLIGHSIGAYAAVIVTGTTPDFSEIGELRQVQHLLKDIDFKQVHLPEVCGLVLLDPAISNAFNGQIMTNNTSAALIYSEYQDAATMGDPIRYKQLFSNLQACCELSGVGHYVYINKAPKILQKISPRVCGDFDGMRTMSHERISQTVGDFLTQNTLQSVPTRN